MTVWKTINSFYADCSGTTGLSEHQTENFFEEKNTAMSAYNFKCSSRFQASNSGIQAGIRAHIGASVVLKGAFVFVRAPGWVVSR